MIVDIVSSKKNPWGQYRLPGLQASRLRAFCPTDSKALGAAHSGAAGPGHRILLSSSGQCSQPQRRMPVSHHACHGTPMGNPPGAPSANAGAGPRSNNINRRLGRSPGSCWNDSTGEKRATGLTAGPARSLQYNISGEQMMRGLLSGGERLAGWALTGLVCMGLTGGEAQDRAPGPVFSANQIGWIATNPDFVAVPGGPSPTRSDPAYPYVPNNSGAQPTFRVADLANPNIKPWAKEVMRRENAKVLAGGSGYTARSGGMPAGGSGIHEIF